MVSNVPAALAAFCNAHFTVLAGSMTPDSIKSSNFSVRTLNPTLFSWLSYDNELTTMSDEIPAYLSDGEYVIDAETVSMLGDGSNKAGAEVLNDMRKSIRQHKGSNLVNGEFSDDAMSPLEYMRGN